MFIDNFSPFEGPFDSPEGLEDPVEIPADSAIYDYAGDGFVSWDGLESWWDSFAEWVDGTDVHDYLDNYSIEVVSLRHLKGQL